MRYVLVAVLAVALVASPAAGAQGGAPGPDAATLFVGTGSLRGKQYTTISLSTSSPIAALTAFVPRGFSLDSGRATGTEIGELLTVLAEAEGGRGAFGNGAVVVDDPTRYAGDANAQACAPGAHLAVWRATLSGGGRTRDLPIFVDAARSGDPAGAAYVLRACPVWLSTEVGIAHRAAVGFWLSLEGVLTAPAASGKYSWSAVVTPTRAASVTADPSHAFEVRATMLFPRVLTLRAKYERKSSTVLLRGRLMAAGAPEAGALIEFDGLDDPSRSSFSFGPARTNRNGEFQVRRRVERTTQFAATVRTEPARCTTLSSAPAGCASETVTPPTPAFASVVVREKTEPRLAVRPHDRALARRASLQSDDFPGGWDVTPLPVPLDLCPTFDPDLSALTATGEWESPLFGSDTTAAASSTTVYATVAEARTAFSREAQIAVARCLAREARKAGSVIHSVGRLVFPHVGQETRAFRVVAEDDRAAVTYLDLISFRRGRVVVHMWVAGLELPLDLLERTLAANVHGRAG